MNDFQNEDFPAKEGPPQIFIGFEEVSATHELFILQTLYYAEVYLEHFSDFRSAKESWASSQYCYFPF